MHTNSIIELNNTAYQKTLFSPNHFWEKVQISCVVKGNDMELQKSFQWPKTELPISPFFDVQEESR
jgi:hypothetical protein